MNPIQLFAQYEGGLEPSGIWYCQKCRIVHSSAEKAEECCKPRLCNCGKPIKKGWAICDECVKSSRLIKEHDRFTKAEKLTEWDGPVFCDGVDTEYFECVSHFLDFCEPGDEPQYVWTCDKIPFVTGLLDCISEHISEAAYDDFGLSDLHGLKDLKEAITKFEAANKGHVLYRINYNRALLITPEPSQP
jgi:hypothetical protein